MSFSTWVSFLPQRIFFEKRILQNCFPPLECPFQWGSVSSLSASLLGNAFKKTSSSLRLSLSTWVAFLLQRIIFEKCIYKLTFIHQSVLVDLGLFPPSAHLFREVYLQNSFPPSECPFRPGFLSSLSASFLRSVFKKSLSSLRVSFSTWVSCLPQRILFEKRIQEAFLMHFSNKDALREEGDSGRS